MSVRFYNYRSFLWSLRCAFFGLEWQNNYFSSNNNGSSAQRRIKIRKVIFFSIFKFSLEIPIIKCSVILTIYIFMSLKTFYNLITSCSYNNLFLSITTSVSYLKNHLSMLCYKFHTWLFTEKCWCPIGIKDQTKCLNKGSIHTKNATNY